MKARIAALATVLALAFGAVAQTESQGDAKPQGKTEKLWRIETSGIGG